MYEYVIRLLYWKKIIHFVSERRRRNHIPSFQQRLVSNPLGLISLPIAVLSSARWYNTQSTSCLWSWEAATEKEKHAEGHAYVVCFTCMCPGARHCPSTKKKKILVRCHEAVTTKASNVSPKVCGSFITAKLASWRTFSWAASYDGSD